MPVLAQVAEGAGMAGVRRVSLTALGVLFQEDTPAQLEVPCSYLQRMIRPRFPEFHVLCSFITHLWIGSLRVVAVLPDLLRHSRCCFKKLVNQDVMCPSGAAVWLLCILRNQETR